MNAIAPITQPQSSGLLALGTGHSVLGECPVRIPIGGKIRAGIKVLKREAAANPQAADIYRDGVARGDSWATIEKRLAEQLKLDSAALIPRNVEHFGVKRADFSVPAIADRILELYGDDRGDGRKLYRFPVLFAFDHWLANMPHGMHAYTASELRFWSDYAPDGTRLCKQRQAVDVDPRAKRAHRVFGGRPEVVRRVCEPNKCGEFKSGACHLSGRLIFWIPGIPGSSAFELPTTSFYAMRQWRSQFELVSMMRGGKISGMQGRKPIFWLTKRFDSTPMVDPSTGQSVKREAWVVHLEADLPMDLMFADADQDADRAIDAGRAAAHALEHGTAADDDLSDGALPPEESVAPVQAKDARSEVKAGRRRLFGLLEGAGINANAFALYAAQKWGDDWSHRTPSLAAAAEEVDAAEYTRDAQYVASINALTPPQNTLPAQEAP